jgi:hypothetical protein
MPTPMPQRLQDHSRELVNLDDAEMMLELMALDPMISVAVPETMAAADWLTELNSAASMIMDREEREALAQELALMNLPRCAAA